MRWLWVGLGVMLVLIGVGAFINSVYLGGTSTSAPGPMMMMTYWPFGWFGWIFGAFFIIWIFSWVFGWAWWGPRRYYRRRWYRYYGGDSAEEILRQRYAKGEITKEQFEQMMRDLQAHQAPA